MAKVPDKDIFKFLDKQNITSQYSRSPGSWRHVGDCKGNLWLLRGKAWMAVLFLLYIFQILSLQNKLFSFYNWKFYWFFLYP